MCRPAGKGESLVEALVHDGAAVRCLPMLHVQPVDNEDQGVKQCIMDLDQFTHVIFISDAAAEQGAVWIDRYWPQLPVGLQWYAIGRQTARRLCRELGLGAHEIQQPIDGIDSEALLALPSLEKEMQGANVLIVRGRGGRPLLGDALQSRGARVQYAEVYERGAPDYRAADLHAALTQFDPQLIVCLSAETANNLNEMAHRVRFDLSKKSFIMPSQRAVNECFWLSEANSVIPESLAEPDIASSINVWWQTNDSIKVGE